MPNFKRGNSPTREEQDLLRLVAAAAEMSVIWDDNTFKDPSNLCRVWNPLQDDGDALRLAVKLHLFDALKQSHRLVDDKTDFYAAARRSIVLAAAEIGKNTTA